MDNEKKKWITVLIIGIIALVAGIVVFFSDKNIDENYTGSTTAIVLEYEEAEEYSSSMEMLETVYYPVLKYSVDGTEFTEKYSQYYSDLEYPIGSSVDISYLPDDPSKFSITEDNRGTIITMWEVPVGILLIVLAIYKLRSTANGSK